MLAVPQPADRPIPRVVVTGIGLRTALGTAPEETWRHLKAGRIAARFLDLPGSVGSSAYAGFPIERPRSPPTLHVIEAAGDAARDAGLAQPAEPNPRAATVIGLSKGDLGLLARLHRARLEGGEPPGGQFPFLTLWPQTWPNHAASQVASDWNHRGPCLAPVAACATGVVAVLQAADLIRRGVCDFAFAGGGDASLEPLVLGAFRKMKALARVDGDPAEAVRPWDRRRSGFLVGEGAAVLVLESEAHSRSRGARPYAEIAGGSLGSDAYHLTDLNPDPANLAALIGRALADANVSPEEIDYVNLHGTATRSNDPLECRALRLALGDQADRLACSANKAQIGHLLGAAGAAELAITCLAIRDGFIPPTRNLTDPDEACDLDATPEVGRARSIRVALKLSLGFGGHLAVAVLKCPEGDRRIASNAGDPTP